MDTLVDSQDTFVVESSDNSRYIHIQHEGVDVDPLQVPSVTGNNPAIYLDHEWVPHEITMTSMYVEAEEKDEAQCDEWNYDYRDGW